MNRLFLLNVLLMPFLLMACSLPVIPSPAVSQPDYGLRLYVQPLPQEAQNLTLTLADFAAIRADGVPVPLTTSPLKLDGNRMMEMQKRLLATPLPPGDYQGLSLRVANAELRTDEGMISLLVSEEPFVLKEDFRVLPDSALALFLALEPQRLVTDGYRLTPLFSLWKSRPALPELKGLISNSDAGTLSVFEKRSSQVVGVLTVGRQPKGLALDSRQRRAYVALAGDDSLAAIDLINEKVQDKLRLRAGDGPSELAISPDGGTLVTANAATASLSIVSTSPLAEQGRLLLTTAPGSVFFGPASTLVYLLQPDINTLALVDTHRQDIIASANLEFSPIRGTASPDGRSLYLITDDSPYLLVLDAASLRVTDRILVGYGARSLAVHPHSGLVYVGMASGEIAFIDPALSLPIDTLQGDEEAVWLHVDLEENALFVVSTRHNRVAKYDLVSKKRLGLLEAEAGSYAAVLMGD
ncbi:hypothetical protein MJO47_11720 [Desulfuromonas sp. KJ2020]|uniref:YncE family protein n=1 Tax=Desulfuromonas sp. KJ2020 TaxID=2919173 RepID=UPI0020A77EFF|nr:hypothetical protein [Desulfuromonas sp. KJ2020]MCP3177773.1 hypothetical protein [Desulfuromonas sp. KJ2020]